MNVNVKKIIEDSGVDTATVAKALFPENNFPKPALSRVLNGEALLNTVQVEALAKLTHRQVGELFDVDGWVNKGSDGNCLKLTRNGYTATLDFDRWTSVIVTPDGNVLDTLLHSKSIKLSEYVDMLNTII